MTGHLEDFVWAINPLHSSKAGSGCEVKPGWKGQALLRIWVFVPGGQKASLLIMGIFISPWGAAPTWWLFARTGTAGMTQRKGHESNSSSWHRKGKRFLSWSQRGMWWHGAHHTPSTSFISLRWLEEAAPKLAGLFFSSWIAQRVLSQPCLAFSCLAPSPFHISASGV